MPAPDSRRHCDGGVCARPDVAASGSRRELHVRSGSVDGAGPGPTAGAARRHRLRASRREPTGSSIAAQPSSSRARLHQPVAHPASAFAGLVPRVYTGHDQSPGPAIVPPSHLLTTVAPRFVTKYVSTPREAARRESTVSGPPPWPACRVRCEFLGGPSGSQMELIAAQCCSRWSGSFVLHDCQTCWISLVRRVGPLLAPRSFRASSCGHERKADVSDGSKYAASDRFYDGGRFGVSVNLNRVS